MSIRIKRVYLVLTLLTVVVMLASIFQPGIVAEFQLLIAGTLVAVIGIPHGATDYILFKNLIEDHYPNRKKNVSFLVYYNCLLLGYSLVWFFIPTAAFIIFLALSVYHFGQSNWNYLKTNNLSVKTLSYIIWGSFVIFVPVSIHIDEAILIIESMTSSSGLVVDYALIADIPQNLLIINIWLLFFLLSRKAISRLDFFREISILILLYILFHYTPLLVGFSIYFGLWHSFGSVLDQIEFIKTRKNSHYNIRKYYLDALPMIALSFGGMALLWYINSIGWMPFSIVSLFFVMIAIVTLPHMLLIERLYERLSKKPPIVQQWMVT